MAIAGLSAAVGMTPEPYLADLCARHSKLETMALEVGIAHQSLYQAMRYYKVSRLRSYDFDYDGIVDSFRGHCRRYGIKPEPAEMMAYKYGLNRYQSLTMALIEKKGKTMTDKIRGTIARRAAQVGKTKSLLADLCKRHVKIKLLAGELGVSHVAVIRALKSVGIEWKNLRHFDYCGVTDNLTNHRRRYGIEPWRVFRKSGQTWHHCLSGA